MRREASPPRPDWERKCEEVGFDFHRLGGEPYWTEDARYCFSVSEIDEIDEATAELHRICLEAVEHVVANRLYERLSIPPQFGPYIETTWRRADPTVCGRFDLAFDGRTPPKMLEYNADTPTALLEAAVVQWHWLKEVIPGADQFNSAHEKLIEAWRGVAARLPPGATVHFARSEQDPEDLATSEYLRDVCGQAGLATKPIAVADIGWNGARFTDRDETPIHVLSKLYPWEWMAREDFGRHVLSDTTAFVEPAWKMVLSNKALLPLLWEGFPGHPNLLPAFHEPRPELGPRSVRKPVFGREGANVEIVGAGAPLATDGPYGAEGYIHQAYAPLPVFDGMHAVIGSWVVGGETAGIGLREDPSPITHNRSRFVPHYF